MPFETSTDILDDIAQAFRPYLHNLWQGLDFGLCKTKVELERLTSSGDELSNQFTLVLPYCVRKLKWEVIFDHEAPWLAPDFRFDDESFLSNADCEFLENHVPSLADWDGSKPQALTKVISELISLYRIHQTKLLSEDESSRAYFEYTALLGDAVTKESDIEVWVSNHLVQFLIRLNVDTSRLPEIFNEGTNQNPGVETALLLVRYPNPTNAELVLSPLLTRIVGNISPPPMHQSGVLMDYVPMVTELLNKKIQTVLLNERLKRELLAQLIVKYGGAVLEHDANGASFLFQIDNFYWILQIEIGPNFPAKNPPILILRSVYHCSKGRPRVKVLPQCPYHNIEQYMEQQVEIFKNECKGVICANQLLHLDG